MITKLGGSRRYSDNIPGFAAGPARSLGGRNVGQMLPPPTTKQVDLKGDPDYRNPFRAMRGKK